MKLTKFGVFLFYGPVDILRGSRVCLCKEMVFQPAMNLPLLMEAECK